MKLHNEAAPVETFGVTESSSFSIAMNAKAFRVLSDSLYENKIGSIVREISCNAYDAHIMAGKKDVPFEIHLPNAFEPWFSVQDYGVGLSPEAIKTVFTVYFSSTKDQSNDAIGAFGLGAKTPFAYTDQFTVTSVVDGTKRIYSAYISGSGVPDIALMDETTTDEQNGVEIRMSVKREDYNRFASEVIEQLQYFKVKPILKNSNTSFREEIRNPSYISDNCVVYPNGRYSNYVAIQGNVGYTLNVNTLENSTAALPYKKSISFLNTLHNHDVHLIFPIGSIGVTASREGVEYDDKTVTNICKSIENLEKDYLKQLKDRISEIPTDWEKITELQKDTFNMQFVSEFKFAPEFKNNRGIFLDITGVTHKKVTEQVDVMISGVLQKKDVVRSVAVATVNSINANLYNNRRNRAVVHNMQISEKEKIVIIGRDKHILAERKLQYFFNNNKQYTVPYEVRSEDGTDVKVIINKLKALMGVDVKVVMLSEIVLPEEAKKPVIRNGITQYYTVNNVHEHSIRKWNPVRDIDLDDVTEELYYLTHDGAYVNSDELSQAVVCMENLGIDARKKLIAISSKKEVLILDKPNFINFSILKKKSSAELEKQKVKLIKEYRILSAQVAFSTNLRDIKFLDSIAAELPDCELAKLYNVSRGINAKTTNINKSMLSVKNKLNTIGVNTEALTDKVSRRVNKFCATIQKYPLLPVLSNWYYRDAAKAKDVVQYVKALNATF